MAVFKETKKDKKEYQKLKRNVQDKIRRIKTNFGVDVSSDINVPSFDSFKGEGGRQRFNEFKRSAKSFTSRFNTAYQFVKNQYGLVKTKKELNDLKRANKRAIALAKKEDKRRRKLDRYVEGEKAGKVGDRANLFKTEGNATDVYIPKEFDFEQVKSEYMYSEKKKSIEERSDTGYFTKRDEQLKKNFLFTLQEYYNSDADELVLALNEISPDEFSDLFNQFEEFRSVFFYEKESGETYTDDDFIGQLWGYYNKYRDGQVDKDLKNTDQRR